MEIHKHSEVCECDIVHSDVVAHVKEVMEDTEVVYALSDFFKVMSDSTRMRIMAVLDNEELCVCDLSAVLGMTKSAVSHQLKVLKDAQLVKFRRDGKNVFYTLKDDHVKTILEMGIEHIKERD
ncbi:MAG: winged helix-turn-helix transcriptional regulator [Clostridia bacterium]|nr:winged helix-turn-helix transcriptional regulator [Clostridia bacterium]